MGREGREREKIGRGREGGRMRRGKGGGEGGRMRRGLHSKIIRHLNLVLSQ